MKRLLYFFFVASSMSQEVTTPASLLGPKYYNHHAFDAEQYLKSLNLPVPTQKGPVLFPNDAPPPPRPPLVVTSRPLIESIARSNLNPLNNTIAQSSNNGVSFVPYLGRVKEYKPYYNIGDRTVTERYYQTQTSLPELYKTIGGAKTIGAPEQRVINYYQIKEPEYTHQQSNEVHDENSADYGNYAFSYTVKDKNTGDDFSHSQKSSGSATNGEYRVRLPDGRMQIVSYTADENGYNADVRYDEISNNGDINNYNTDYKHVDDTNNHITEKNDYQYDNEQPKDLQKDYYNNYDPKEYYNDYSSEYNENYLPHNNKFTNLINKNSNIQSSVSPSYEEIKHLFTPNKFYSKIDSTTSYPFVTSDSNLIGAKPNLYTNILQSTVSPIIATTPRSYLVSTIASLRNKLNLNQPVLSGRFIDKINKYLKFN